MPALVAVNFLEIQDMLLLMARTVGILHAASAAGSIDAVKALIDSNADLIARDSHGCTALEVASDPACKEEIERAIVLADGWTPLMVNARWGDIERIRFIILHDGKGVVNARNVDGSCRTALHYAAERGHTSAVLELITAKAEINATDKVKYLAQHMDAVVTIKPDTVSTKSDPADSARQWSQTPLFIASSFGHAASIRVLVEHGACINVVAHVSLSHTLNRRCDDASPASALPPPSSQVLPHRLPLRCADPERR